MYRGIPIKIQQLQIWFDGGPSLSLLYATHLISKKKIQQNYVRLIIVGFLWSQAEARWKQVTLDYNQKINSTDIKIVSIGRQMRELEAERERESNAFSKVTRFIIKFH